MDNLPDVHKVFIHEKLYNYKDKITITVKLIEIIQKPHLFKIVMEEKVERLKFITNVAK